MNKVKRIYPTRSFYELDETVKSKAVKAGQLGFVNMYSRFTGVFSSRIADEANAAWNDVMNAIDRTYGECNCGDKNADDQCPSFDEHCMVAWFIDEMEGSGTEAADLGLRLHKGTLDFFTNTISDRIHGTM